MSRVITERVEITDKMLKPAKRLIDANALIAEMHNIILEDGEDRRTFYEVIERQPTIEERKVGKWLDAEWENINTGEKRKGRRCSVCKCGYFRYDVSVNTVSDIPNFCPNCGAKMEGNA